jgi:hypothetical protein
VATKHINIGNDAMANGSEANVVSSTRRASACRQRLFAREQPGARRVENANKVREVPDFEEIHSNGGSN